MLAKTRKYLLLSVIAVFLSTVGLILPVTADVSSFQTNLFSVPEKTTFLNSDGVSNQVMSTSLTNYGPLNIPQGLTSSSSLSDTNYPVYQMVTFDDIIPVRLDNVMFPITLYGVNYTVPMTRLSLTLSNDGIDSYRGTVPGLDDVVVLITVNQHNVVYGSVNFPNETLVIQPVQRQSYAAQTANPLHIIYASSSLPFSDEHLMFCGNTNDEIAATFNSSLSSATNSMAIVSVLGVTDTYFVQSESDWQAAVRQYLSQANYQFERDDIQVSLGFCGFDSSKSHALVTSTEESPRFAFSSVYSTADLDSYNADIGIYFGGVDIPGGMIGYSDVPTTGTKRFLWVQMKEDSSNSVVTGDYMGRVHTTIHELGHIFGGQHTHAIDYTDSTAPGGLRSTVMEEYYDNPATASWIFSSAAATYPGDANHDNAGLIRAKKVQVSSYV
ncbi:MAG TPA: M12 family metallo-peptidase [Methanocorpusculum sp.]|nr:M12 family metallo-peptidase [Methanocorpusculum sp.]